MFIVHSQMIILIKNQYNFECKHSYLSRQKVYNHYQHGKTRKICSCTMLLHKYEKIGFVENRSKSA